MYRCEVDLGKVDHRQVRVTGGPVVVLLVSMVADDRKNGASMRAKVRPGPCAVVGSSQRPRRVLKVHIQGSTRSPNQCLINSM